MNRDNLRQLLTIFTMADTLLLGKPMREVLLRARAYIEGRETRGASIGAQVMLLVHEAGSLDERRAWLAAALLLRLYEGEFDTEVQRRWVADSARALVEGRYEDLRPLDFQAELSNYRMFL